MNEEKEREKRKGFGHDFNFVNCRGSVGGVKSRKLY